MTTMHAVDNERRLFWGVVSLLILLAGSAILISVVLAPRVSDAAAGIAHTHSTALTETLALNAGVNQVAQEALAYAVSREPSEREEALLSLANLDVLRATFSSTNVHSKFETHRAVFESVLVDQRAFAVAASLLIEGVDAADATDATGGIDADLWAEFETRLDSLGSGLESLISLEETTVLTEQLAALQAERQARNNVLWQGFGLAALSLMAAGATVVLFGRMTAGRETAERDLAIQFQALEATSVGVVVANARAADDPVIYVNPSFERITGYRADEVVGRNCRLLQGPRSDRRVVETMRNALERSEPVSALIENYTKLGVPFWNEMRISPVLDGSGEVTHFVGAINDVSERVGLAHRVLRAGKMHAVGQLAGGIAHDFNNYLMVIEAATSVIKSDPKADVDHWLDQISAAGRRSAALTQQLMSFTSTSMIAGETTDLGALVTGLEPLLRGTIDASITMEVIVATDTGLVSGNRSQLEQVVTNLVLNARDAMPNGGTMCIETGNKVLTAADVSAEPQADSGDHVMISVSDNGAGVDPAIANEIFEPFVTTKDAEFGRGLGLATVYGVVSKAGGMLNVQSAPGQGATFTVYLPRIDDGLRAAETVPVVAASIDTVADGTVLLVEDDAIVRGALAGLLLSLGYQVVEAANGQLALDCLRDRPDLGLVVSDVTMPVMGGIEMAHRAQEIDPDIKVLLVSGYTQSDLEGLGPSIRSLTKPFTLDDLGAALAGLVAGVDQPVNQPPSG